MKCSEVKKLLFSDYADRELSPEAHRKVSEHLETCERCREEQINIRYFVTGPLQKAAGSSALRKDLWPGIKAAIKVERTLSVPETFFAWLKEYSFFRKPAFAIAVVSVFLLFFVFGRLHWNDREKELYSFIEEQFLFLDSMNYDDKSFMEEDIGIPGEASFG